jgi:hypothetical protein
LTGAGATIATSIVGAVILPKEGITGVSGSKHTAAPCASSDSASIEEKRREVSIDWAARPMTRPDGFGTVVFVSVRVNLALPQVDENQGNLSVIAQPTDTAPSVARTDRTVFKWGC